MLQPYVDYPSSQSLQELEQKLQSVWPAVQQQRNCIITQKQNVTGWPFNDSPHPPTPYRPEAILATRCMLCAQWPVYTQSPNSEDCCSLVCLLYISDSSFGLFQFTSVRIFYLLFGPLYDG